MNVEYIQADHGEKLISRNVIPELLTNIIEMDDAEKGTLEEALTDMESIDMNYLKYDREMLLNCF